MKLLLISLLLVAGCAATPTIPTNANGQAATISCSRLTSVYGVGTLIVVDLGAPRAPGAATLTTDGNDCKTTITYSQPPKAAASGAAP
jgi:hypothetical protein